VRASEIVVAIPNPGTTFGMIVVVGENEVLHHIEVTGKNEFSFVDTPPDIP
jgi:hypothetical protein